MIQYTYLGAFPVQLTSLHLCAVAAASVLDFRLISHSQPSQVSDYKAIIRFVPTHTML